MEEPLSETCDGLKRHHQEDRDFSPEPAKACSSSEIHFGRPVEKLCKTFTSESDQPLFKAADQSNRDDRTHESLRFRRSCDRECAHIPSVAVLSEKNR